MHSRGKSAFSPWFFRGLKKQKENYEEPPALKTYREEGLQNLLKFLTPHLKTLRKEKE